MQTLITAIVAAGLALGPAPIITERVQEPVFVDECGFLSDSYSYVESSSGRFEWREAVVTNPDGSFEQVILRAVPVAPYEFRGAEKKRVFTFTYTNDEPCDA